MLQFSCYGILGGCLGVAMQLLGYLGWLLRHGYGQGRRLRGGREAVLTLRDMTSDARTP